MRLRGHAMTALTDPATASVVWHTPNFSTGSAKWTSTVTPRLLLEGGFSYNSERYDNLYQDGIQAVRGTPAWYNGVRKNDTSLGFTWNAAGAQLGNYPDRYNVAASTSYVTGSHSVKVGFQDSFGPYRRYNTANADLYQTYQNLAPLRVTVLNTPLQVEEYLDANLGLYAQDSWRLNKFTINVGLRFDHVKQHIVGQQAQIGRFANLIPYSDIDMPVWNDVSPRTSVVYDVFGNGKTAVRAGFNKFMTAATTGFAQLYNPTALSATLTLPWTDKNKDDIAEGERGCSFANDPACEINFANLPANFGVRSLSAFDPGLQRPYQMAYNVGLSHEVRSGIAVTAEWFHSNFKDLIARNNVALTASSYTPVTVVNPLDNSLITAYNLKPEFASAVQNVDSTDPNLKRAYNGIEININARLPHGARVFGGTSTERTISNSCSAAGTRSELVALLRSDEERDPVRDIGQVRHDVPAAVVWHHGERIVPGPRGQPPWKRRASVRRVHRGYRFHATQRAGHVPPGVADDELRCDQLQVERVHDRPARHPWSDPDVAQRPADCPAARIHAADQSGRLRIEQVVQRRPHAVHAEAGHLQRVQLRRLHRRHHDAVRRGDLQAAVDHSARPHHPHRRGCEVVDSQGLGIRG